MWPVVVILNLIIVSSFADDYVVSNKRFPKDFVFGTSTSAYQIEGGWNADGKGESIADRATHNYPEKFSNDNGDIACDSYHKYEEDVQLLKEMGVKKYRFSISWARVLPTGFVNQTNPAGIAYYKNLITALKAENIEPLVTMHHFDLPQALEDIGGFLNKDIGKIFEDYAKFLFDTFGDDVKEWLTFNEPKQVCLYGYGEGIIPPFVKNPGITEYECAHNLLIAHARAYIMYDTNYRAKQGGRITMVVDSMWYEPASNSTEDVEAAERMRLFTYGWFVNPLVYGDYPDIMKTRIGYRSLVEGFNKSRLPTFRPMDRFHLKGSFDYLAVNIYTSSEVKAIPEPDISHLSPTRELDCGVETYQPSEWESTVSSYVKVVPWGARKFVKWISDTYGNPEIVVTENGYPDDGSVVNDMDTRGRYHKLYLSNLNDAIYKDGVNLTGYMVWSLIDTFEWLSGYTNAYGLYHVNFTDPERPRTPKDSAAYYKHIVSTRCLLNDTECVD